jgi:hypothetical protein
MNASKYLLERCGCPLPLWYLTPNQISDQTAPDFNLLTAARSQDRIDVVIWTSLFGGDVTGLSVAIHYGAAHRVSSQLACSSYGRAVCRSKQSHNSISYYFERVLQHRTQRPVVCLSKILPRLLRPTPLP